MIFLPVALDCPRSLNGKVRVKADKKGTYMIISMKLLGMHKILKGNVTKNYRLFCGGSFAEEKRGCGATSKRRSQPDFKIDDLGFRLCRTINEPNK